jgi:hypothetical protein
MNYCKTCLQTDTRAYIIFNDEGIYFHANALSKIKVFKKTYKYAFLNLAKNILSSIRYKSKILCSGKEALFIHENVEKYY